MKTKLFALVIAGITGCIVCLYYKLPAFSIFFFLLAIGLCLLQAQIELDNKTK